MKRFGIWKGERVFGNNARIMRYTSFLFHCDANGLTSDYPISERKDEKGTVVSVAVVPTDNRLSRIGKWDVYGSNADDLGRYNLLTRTFPNLCSPEIIGWKMAQIDRAGVSLVPVDKCVAEYPSIFRMRARALTQILISQANRQVSHESNLPGLGCALQPHEDKNSIIARDCAVRSSYVIQTGEHMTTKFCYVGNRNNFSFDNFVVTIPASIRVKPEVLKNIGQIVSANYFDGENIGTLQESFHIRSAEIRSDQGNLCIETSENLNLRYVRHFSFGKNDFEKGIRALRRLEGIAEIMVTNGYGLAG